MDIPELALIISKLEVILKRESPKVSMQLSTLPLYETMFYDMAEEKGVQHALKIANMSYKWVLDQYLGIDTANLAVEQDIKDRKKQLGILKNWFFVTIGFDDKIITVSDIKKAVLKIYEIEPIKVKMHVVEKHRKDNLGEIYVHHHIHMLVETEYSKSKTIQFLFQKLKKFVAAKNFIDVKNDGDRQRYEKYINGDKQADKHVCLELDRKWREENQII